MNVFHNSFYSMGTRFNVVFPGGSEEVCSRLFMLVKAECERIENMLSYFDPMSDVSKINEGAAKFLIGLSDELFSIIETCVKYSVVTFGAFDITLRPVIECLENDPSEQSEETVASDMDQIELDRENKTIHFKNEKVKIDFGGFGKGYALEKIKSLFDDSPIENAFISFGESSITVKGKRPDGNDWQVGIKDFLNGEKSLHTFSLSDSSISTSSNYYVNDASQLQSKINVINPFTKKPVEDLAVASVKSDSPLEAEILSTAFLIMNEEQIFETMKKLNNVVAVKIIYIDNQQNIKIFN
jgi:FAD:protein FMN transferase